MKEINMSMYERSKAKSIIHNRSEITKIVRDTVDKMATVVGSTLGPGGRVVLIERDSLSPLITKDGVTVAKSLGVENAEANIIVDAAKEICLKTAKEAGDGTTTAIVLANAITKNGLLFLEKNPKYNPQRMINELNELYSTTIVPFLKRNAIPAKGRNELVHVATISANGDKEIAIAAVDAVLAAGEDGHVLIEEAQGNQLKVETMDGFIVTSGLRDIGAVGRAFINDRANQQVKMDKGLVFLYDGTLNDLKVPGAIQQAIEGTELYGLPIMVFAHGFADVVIEAFAKTTKGGYTVVPVKTPMSGAANSRSSFLLDMSAYSGATVYDPGTIDRFIEEDVASGFGSFDNAKVGMYESVVQAVSDSEKIDGRIAELKHLMDVSPSDFDKMHIKAAIGKLTGGISTIWVGGGSELEAREKRDRVEDAVEAVKSAIAEGIVPGGCAVQLALAYIINRDPNKKPSWTIMSTALTEPFNLLLSNCGENIEDVWPQLENQYINQTGLPSLVFDANAHEVVEPMSAGIIEPAKVCRVTIGNALSVAGLLTTLGGIVVTPRNSSLEQQLELSKGAFREMMSGATGTVGQE
jgi:chaperonin GroEL